MKIVLISPAHPLRGGIAALSERLAQALQEEGFEVVIYSFSLQYPSFLFPGKSQFTDDPPPPGLRIKTRLNSVNPFNWVKTGLEIAAEAPDLVVARFWLPFMGPSLGTALRVARWKAARPFRAIGLIDNIIPHEKRPGDRPFAQWFASACDAFMVMSRSVGEEIKQFSDKPVRWAPHPIYDNYGEKTDALTARRHLRLPETGPVILFFGFIRAYKGLDLLLEALAEPAVQALNAHTVIAGECYEDWAPYQAIIEARGLADRISLRTDFIPADQVRYYFSAADLVAQPYKTATQSGISQIAYHFEKPMLVTEVGGLAEIVRDGVSGYVCPPEAPAIAEAILDFFTNKRAAAFTEGVRAEKHRFSWKNFVETLVFK